MAADTRPYKSKEQDGQGNEVIIRDQQLVEQGNATTMPSGAFFETLDVDNRPVKIPRDNMMNIVLECIGIILNDNSKNLGTNVQKALGLQGNTIGHSTVADFASVLGVMTVDKRWDCILKLTGSTPLIIDLSTIEPAIGNDDQGVYVLGLGGSSKKPGRQGLVHLITEAGASSVEWITKPYAFDNVITSFTLSGAVLSITAANDWMYVGLRKI